MGLLAIRREQHAKSEERRSDAEELIKRQHAVAQRLHVLEWKADVIRRKDDEPKNGNH